MPLVLDASVCGSWMLPDESHPVGVTVLGRLAQDIGIVPALWWFEVRNLLVINERRGRGSVDNTTASLTDLQRLRLTTDVNPVSDEVLRLARTHRLTAYDSAYLELALRRGAELATLDHRLATAARAEGIAVVGSPLTS